MPKNKTEKKLDRLGEVFRRLVDYLRESPTEIEEAADKLDEWLDEWNGEDRFGTEGSSDPRGDGRSSEPKVRAKRCW